jgi:hypothetical protein
MTEKQILAARKKLWIAGELEWKLKEAQKELYNFIKNTKSKTIVLNCSRRYGKTTTFLILAFEMCIKKPRALVKFSQPKQNMIRKNVLPDFYRLIEDCPADIKPKFNGKDNIIEFPNGSQIHLAGTDGGNAENLRGGSCDMALIDEAGFCDNLGYIIQSIIAPTTILTKGKIVLASTTPPNADHEFIERMKIAGTKEALLVRTIKDALEFGKQDEEPIMTPEIYREEILEQYNYDENHPAFQNEYMCKITSESNSTVVPEFTDDYEQDCVVPWHRPDFCDKYVAMDIGFVDYTFVLFAFYDFQNGVVVIEDELIMNGPTMTTDALADSIKEREKNLWYNKRTGQEEKPTLRVSDNNLIVINDLNRLHQLYFMPTQKDNRDMQINQLRMLIQSNRVIIHPRCKTLVQHLKHASWDKTRKDFKRSEAHGHYDGVMALCYLIRNIDMNRNPYPNGYKYYGISPDDLFINEIPESEGKKTFKEWGKSFVPKNKKKY